MPVLRLTQNPTRPPPAVRDHRRVTFAEHSVVRLTRALAADDGRHLPAGTRGTIVHVWSHDSRPAAYEVEVHFDGPGEDPPSWHLATARPDDLELVAPPPVDD